LIEIEIDLVEPLEIDPDIPGAPIIGASLRFVIVTVKV
jgi:hypothetical protein